MDKDYNIKVADFGLTRDIYATEYYRSDKHTRLPVKWMSLESLLDNFFNEKTDVVRVLHICSRVATYIHIIKFKFIKWSELL